MVAGHADWHHHRRDGQLQRPAIDPALDHAFSGMSFAEVCALALQQAQIKHISAINAKMAHEMAVLKRLKFAATSERFSPEQKSLLDEAIDEDLEVLEREVGKLQRPAKPAGEKRTRSDSRCRPICRAATSTTNRAAPLAPRQAEGAR
jgi:uncharacterized protein (DUF2236 family)